MALPRIVRRVQLILRIDAPQSIPAPAGLTFERITAANASQVLTFRTQSTVRSFKTMLQRDDIGLFAHNRGVVAGHIWAAVARSGPRLHSGYFTLQPGTAMIHYARIDEPHWGQGIFPSFIAELTAQLFEEGIKKVYADTAVTNIGSQRGFLRAGFLPVAHGEYISLGGRLLWSRVQGRL